MELLSFNGLPAFSFRAISHKPFLDPRGPDQRRRVRPANASIQPLCETWIPACAGSPDAGHAISCDRVILKSGRFRHARLGFDDNLAIILENSKIGKLFRFFCLCLARGFEPGGARAEPEGLASRPRAGPN